ncbi:hypothetical protein B296_00000787 [Ensete ventricosum]|uniref:Uncharacterized protein n=1 Tax=Ensete ventricosum TaxID=4639 RepID=A0A427B9V3_ENSVE|nr:hypothetical protein B296_00000787 [Ensete ventricosum]
MPDNRSLKEELTDADDPTNPNDASSFQLNFSNSVVQLKDDGCDSRTEAQIEVMPVTNSEPVKLNCEIFCEPEKKIDNDLADSNCIKTRLLLCSTSGSQEAVLIKRSSGSASELRTSTAGHKKAHEDAILKEARLIEVRKYGTVHQDDCETSMCNSVAVDFERQLPYDGNEISSKSKKKKKPKHLGYKNSLNLAEPGLLVPGKALVVLVHDMGPNWELVSDAINNTLQFKVKEVHDSCFSVFRDQWKRIF